MAALLLDPSMSTFPIIMKQKFQSLSGSSANSERFILKLKEKVILVSFKPCQYDANVFC